MSKSKYNNSFDHHAFACEPSSGGSFEKQWLKPRMPHFKGISAIFCSFSYIKGKNVRNDDTTIFVNPINVPRSPGQKKTYNKSENCISQVMTCIYLASFCGKHFLPDMELGLLKNFSDYTYILCINNFLKTAVCVCRKA